MRQRGNSNTGVQRHRAEEPCSSKPGVQDPALSASPCLCVKNKKLSYNEKRELEQLPARIEALEKEIAEIEAFLSDGTNYAKDPLRCKSSSERLPLARTELDVAESRWLELEERSS